MISLNDLTQAVVAALEAVDLTVGVAQAPESGGWQGEPGTTAFTPYVVVWPLWSTTDGPNSDIHADLERRYGLTSVGVSAEQAERVADRARAAVRAVSIDGQIVWPPEFESQGHIERDDTRAEQPPLFYVADRVRLKVT